MANNKKATENSDLYEELKGFFPEEYDLTPDELEGGTDDITAIADEIPEAIIEDHASPNNVDVEIFESENDKKVSTAPNIDEEYLIKATESAVKKSEKKKFGLADIYDILEMFAVCTACIIIFFSFFARLTIVDGDSMNNTLKNGEYLVISDFMYEPKQGDIVVLQNASLEHEELKKPLIKRIIATGGETVDISSSGIVTVTDKDGNKSTLNESYAFFEMGYYQYPSGHYEVPEGHVFVMGDNRNGSTDSRDNRVGFVDERCIIGRAYMRILPFDAFGTITNPFEKE